jgi:hypothetical protein
MENGKNEQPDVSEQVTGLSADALRGRQSVRATFKLPSQVIELLSVAANQLGLKQKSLFDQLVEDRDVLERVALGAGRYQPVQAPRQQKTYVVSRNSLVSLDAVAKVHGLPRDLLVEISIQRLLAVISAEQEKQRNRKYILDEMDGLLEQGGALLAKTQHMLGADDRATRQLALVLTQLRASVADLAEQIEQGRAIEGYR